MINQTKHVWRSVSMLLVAVVTLSACSISTTGSSSATSAGSDLGAVFISTDSGAHFTQQPYTPSISGKPGSIAGVNIRSLAMDPNDNLAVYLGTYGNGLYYTYNATEGWRKAETFPGNVTVNGIAVSPRNKCDIYAIFANRLYQSQDCSRTWNQIYIDADAKAVFNTLVIDFYNPSNLYLGTSNGDILKSIDGGHAWRVIKRLNYPVAKIALLPSDSRQVFVADVNSGLYTFVTNSITDPKISGNIEANFAVNNWTDLSEVLEDLDVDSAFRDLKIGASDDLILLATENAVAKSPDKGVTWQKLNLLPSENKDLIDVIAIDPKDSNKMYYGTNLTFARSSDGGVTWANVKLPTRRGSSDILIDHQHTNTIYLGVNETGNSGVYK